MYVQLNLGRTVTGEGPLLDDEWDSFRSDARDLLTLLDQSLGEGRAEIKEHIGGDDVYVDYSKQSCHLSILIDDRRTTGADKALIMAQFDLDLSRLASDHRQEEVVLITGRKRIKAREPVTA